MVKHPEIAALIPLHSHDFQLNLICFVLPVFGQSKIDLPRAKFLC